MNQAQKNQGKIQTKIEQDLHELNSNSIFNAQKQDDESQIKQGKWNDEQNIKFTIFITANKQIFKSKEKRKSQRVFKGLSDFIATRSPRQCRSHFQKAIKKFSTIVKMRNFYRNLIGAAEFEARMSESIKNIKIISESKQKNMKSNKQVEAEVQTDPIFMQSYYGSQYQWTSAYPEFISKHLFWYVPNFQ